MGLLTLLPITCRSLQNRQGFGKVQKQHPGRPLKGGPAPVRLTHSSCVRRRWPGRWALPLLLALSACGQPAGPGDPRAASPSGPDRAPANGPLFNQRDCRELQADLPPTTSILEARQAFSRCLRTRRQASPTTASAPAVAPTPPPGASPAERYQHCRLVSSQLERADRAYNSAAARWSALASQPSDPGHRDAQRQFSRSVAELERLIPPEMRAGQPLIPDAVVQFRRCDPTSFR